MRQSRLVPCAPRLDSNAAALRTRRNADVERELMMAILSLVRRRLASSFINGKQQGVRGLGISSDANPSFSPWLSAKKCQKMNLAQFQRGEASKRKHHGDDPESDDHGRFGPTLLLEVMMQGRHAEHAYPEQLERGDLSITETASRTNRPPTMASTSSCLVATAIVPSARRVRAIQCRP